MNDISRNEALIVLGKWERQNQSFSVLCMDPSFSLSSRTARTLLCLDESIEVSLSDDTRLRISISEAVFSRVQRADFPAEYLHVIAEFDDGIRIHLPSRQTHWYFFTAEPSSGVGQPLKK
jgi:hypothetical protein